MSLWVPDLRADSILVNVNATEWGDYYSGLPQDIVALPAGDYLLMLVSPDTQPGALYYAWNPYSSGDDWRTDLEVTVGSTGEQYNLGYNQPSPTPQLAFANPDNKFSEILTLVSPDTIEFGFPDKILSDNQGGSSLIIESVAMQSAPEPSGLGFLSVCGFGLLCRRTWLGRHV
jgi:hypothetical protein